MGEGRPPLPGPDPVARDLVLGPVGRDRFGRSRRFDGKEWKRDALALLRAMLISAASPSGGRQVNITRTYFENGAQRVARGSFHD